MAWACRPEWRGPGRRGAPRAREFTAAGDCSYMKQIGGKHRKKVLGGRGRFLTMALLAGGGYVLDKMEGFMGVKQAVVWVSNLWAASAKPSSPPFYAAASHGANTRGSPLIRRRPSRYGRPSGRQPGLARGQSDPAATELHATAGLSAACCLSTAGRTAGVRLAGPALCDRRPTEISAWSPWPTPAPSAVRPRIPLAALAAAHAHRRG